MRAVANRIYDYTLFDMGGGILSSSICFILFFLSQDIQFQYAFFTMGWIQLFYGLYEGFIGTKYRFYIYAIVGIICTIFWFVI